MDNGAPRGGDWFSEHEIQQSNLITLLQEKDTTPSIRAEAAAREKALIVEILACNAKGQDRVVPCRANLLGQQAGFVRQAVRSTIGFPEEGLLQLRLSGWRAPCSEPRYPVRAHA